jgi:hypothetical protein
VKTFWRFERQRTTSGCEILIPERFSASTATQIVFDSSILVSEVRKVVVVRRNQRLNLSTIKGMAPNLAHWSTDGDLLELLNQCPPSGDKDETETTNLDRIRRRKHVPVLNFVDRLMATRLGLSAGAINTYRLREQRALSAQEAKNRRKDCAISRDGLFVGLSAVVDDGPNQLKLAVVTASDHRA